MVKIFIFRPLLDEEFGKGIKNPPLSLKERKLWSQSTFLKLNNVDMMYN